MQFPANLQSHNRYSYALNNPLAHTDPSGHFLKGLIRPLASIAISVWLPGADIWTGTGLFAANGAGGKFANRALTGAAFSQAFNQEQAEERAAGHAQGPDTASMPDVTVCSQHTQHDYTHSLDQMA